MIETKKGHRHCKTWFQTLKYEEVGRGLIHATSFAVSLSTARLRKLPSSTTICTGRNPSPLATAISTSLISARNSSNSTVPLPSRSNRPKRPRWSCRSSSRLGPVSSTPKWVSRTRRLISSFAISAYVSRPSWSMSRLANRSSTDPLKAPSSSTNSRMVDPSNISTLIFALPKQTRT
ncbi:unnamed protein product [Musa acuminata subsp. malaccensis]|uniref:(wild Malaysian banana) hypothetical protein n=1 Tax=Musa acuminata subsp. malaccensis TaxID=214687 RepID=A0A8D6ZTN7_MUSAM|nr:unnamed protein product [Musa acuminata subsp. malaccensis]